MCVPAEVEQIIRKMIRVSRAQSSSEEQKPVLCEELDLLELFGSEGSLGEELQRLGGTVLGNSWDLRDAEVRRKIAKLVVTVRPKACHVSLPEGSTAEVQRFVCMIARHMHSKGLLCSIEMPADLEQQGAARVFLGRSSEYEHSDRWVFCSHRLANYSLTGLEWNPTAPARYS